MRRTTILSLSLAGAAAVSIATMTTVAHETYDGCAQCHGDFFGPQSPQGTVFPSNSKHTMHVSSDWMNTDCGLCHTEVGDTPMIGMSAGTANNPGVSCTGCHGRDYGGALGNSGVGLRAHHVQAGVSCSPCHDSDPMPLPENVAPTYYGTVDTNVDDPCNTAPDFLENWSLGDTLGSDNDGDGLYDEADPDCSGTCMGDLDGSGDIGFGDLLAVLSNWGPCPGCPADIDGNDDVGFSDLLFLLSNWGGCP